MQQINLYLPEFQPNREPLRSVHMLWGLIVFILVLLLMSYFSSRSNRELEVQVEKSRVQLEQLKNQAALLEQQRPTGNLADLDAQLLKLSHELARRDKTLQVVSNKNFGNSTGFSAHLHALGRQSLDTISLEAFSLQAGGNYIELAGKTRSVDQIPHYIQRLRNESAFAESAFGVLNAEPQQKTANVFEFSLTREMLDDGNEVPKTAVQKLLELNKDVEQRSRGSN